MKIKNKTNSAKELTDMLTGKRMLVDGGKSIELERASFNKNTFKVIKKKYKNEQIEEINIEKEVI